MITITKNDFNALRTAQDEAASHFWSYPDEIWQMNFQADWLLKKFNVITATSPDGLLLGVSL